MSDQNFEPQGLIIAGGDGYYYFISADQLAGYRVEPSELPVSLDVNSRLAQGAIARVEDYVLMTGVSVHNCVTPTDSGA